jgi:hypothetical protein
LRVAELPPTGLTGEGRRRQQGSWRMPRYTWLQLKEGPCKVGGGQQAVHICRRAGVHGATPTLEM